LLQFFVGLLSANVAANLLLVFELTQFSD
jgi:hypothetical protein